MTELELARFMSKVTKTESCWLWTASKNRKGYGQFRLKGVLWVTSRLAYTHFKSKIPNNLVVMHSCDNPSCVNPAHLNLGTVLDNAKDRDNKKRHKPLKGAANGMCKVTEQQVLEIKSLYASGLHTYRSLGKLFGVDFTAIPYILNTR